MRGAQALEEAAFQDSKNGEELMNDCHLVEKHFLEMVTLRYICRTEHDDEYCGMFLRNPVLQLYAVKHY